MDVIVSAAFGLVALFAFGFISMGWILPRSLKDDPKWLQDAKLKALRWVPVMMTVVLLAAAPFLLWSPRAAGVGSVLGTAAAAEIQVRRIRRRLLDRPDA